MIFKPNKNKASKAIDTLTLWETFQGQSLQRDNKDLEVKVAEYEKKIQALEGELAKVLKVCTLTDVKSLSLTALYTLPL